METIDDMIARDTRICDYRLMIHIRSIPFFGEISFRNDDLSVDMMEWNGMKGWIFVYDLLMRDE